MAQSKTVTTVTYPVDEFNQLIRGALFDGRDVNIEYLIQEVGGDPMDRYPGRNQVTSVRISYDGTPLPTTPVRKGNA